MGQTWCVPPGWDHLLIVHRVNQPADGPPLLAQGARGLEMDVVSNGTTWYVHHDWPQGLTVADYMHHLATWPQKPTLVYLDIKTPRAPNLPQLYALTQAVHPDVQFVFSTAHDGAALLALPLQAVLCVDYQHQASAHALFVAAVRRFWVADGIAFGLRKTQKALALPQQGWAVGKLGWTYAQLAPWHFDLVHYQLDASIVTRELLPAAWAVLQRPCADTSTAS